MTTEALRPPVEYDVAVEMLSKHFAIPCNVRLQRYRFRERRQLQGRFPVLGSFHAIVAYKGKEAIVTFHVTPCGTSLLGLDAVQALGLRIMGEELRCLQMSTQECRELPAMISGLPQSPQA
ncbi:hypothetical protein MRX96_041890 [Rhipicephalus microplus]